MEAPIYAIQIWLEGGDLKVMYNDAGQKHVVTIQQHTLGFPNEIEAQNAANKIRLEGRSPSDKPLLAVRGWLALTRILRDRMQSKKTPRIGESASITQHQLDKMVKEFGGQVKVVGKKRSLSDMTLEDLGL